MSDDQNLNAETAENDLPDAIAAAAIIAIVVGCVTFWLAGMPS